MTSRVFFGSLPHGVSRPNPWRFASTRSVCLKIEDADGPAHGTSAPPARVFAASGTTRSGSIS